MLTGMGFQMEDVMTRLGLFPCGHESSVAAAAAAAAAATASRSAASLRDSGSAHPSLIIRVSDIRETPLRVLLMITSHYMHYIANVLLAIKC